MKNSLLYIMLCLLFIIVGCANNTGKTLEENTGTLEEEITNTSLITLTWGVPDFYSISSDTLTLFNARLRDNGFDFQVKFIPLDIVNYSRSINEYESENRSLDIYFAGFADNQYIISDLINNNYLESLESFINNTPEIKQLYHDIQWEAASLNSVNYFIPAWNTIYTTVYAFNTQYYSDKDLEEFTGLPKQIGQLLNKDIDGAKVLLTDSFPTSILPFDNVTGTMLKHETGRAVNIYEDDDYIGMITALNRLYLEGRLVEYRSGTDVFDFNEFAICMLESIEKAPDSGFILWESKPYISSRPAGLAVRSQSNNKEKVFELLRFIYTDSEAINILIYGISEVDYIINETGQPVTPDGHFIDSFFGEMALGFGRFPNLLPSLCTPDMPGRPHSIDIDPVKYIENHTLPSPFIGFWPVTDGKEEQAVKLANMLNDYTTNPIWKNNNFNDLLSVINTELRETGIDDWLTEVNNQLDQFMKDRNHNE